jgi:hypothetical protein
MKFAPLVLACCGACLCAADLATAHTVYILGMAHGMDQFLANRIVNGHVFQVVTDPKLADVIITDHIGPSFEAQLAALTPAPEEDKDKDTEPVAKPDKDKDKDKTPVAAGDPVVNQIFSTPVNKLAPVPQSSMGRNKGTYFMVDAKSKEIIWSVYDPPKNTDSRTLDRTASDIVSRIKRDMKKK